MAPLVPLTFPVGPYVPLVTPEFDKVVVILHPAWELAVPVTSPVKVIDCAEANLVAVSAFPFKLPWNPSDLMEATNFPSALVPLVFS